MKIIVGCLYLEIIGFILLSLNDTLLVIGYYYSTVPWYHKQDRVNTGTDGSDKKLFKKPEMI